VKQQSGPARWHSTNLVGIPAALIASASFNANPVPLHVAAARECHPGLFALLTRCANMPEARGAFEHYMNMAFSPAPRADVGGLASARRWRASYLKLLQGWGLDANGAAGAVLKGWVESRFGIVPVFHAAPLAAFPSAAWTAYLEAKATTRWHNNNIFQQLDLLFEFSQWMLGRFKPLGTAAQVRLWRGSTRCEEQIVRGSLKERHCTVRLNNLVSFSRSREQAGCFGDWMLQAEVPQTKLLLWPGLLNAASLRGEAEVLALGGDYEVLASYE
jgi:NAD+---dinitrogen-reductase ADP-D-ribosyltransferase